MTEGNMTAIGKEPSPLLPNTPERKPCTACKVLVHFSWRYCPACGTPTGYNYKGIKMTIEELARETAVKLREIIDSEDTLSLERATERLIEELQYQIHYRSHISIEIAKLKER